MVTAYGPKDPRPFDRWVNTTSQSTDWGRGLSPFFLGPVFLPDGSMAVRMENSWQFSKCYEDQVDAEGNPTPEWWVWRKQGFASSRAQRYPRGKGAKPLYSYWQGKHLDYVTARQEIYIPLYRQAVIRTAAWAKLQTIYETGDNLALFDFDGYPFNLQGLTYTDVLNNTSRALGHSIVLCGLLEDVDWGMLQVREKL